MTADKKLGPFGAPAPGGGEYFTVEVTADDIASGVRGDCESCPVAIATRRALGATGCEVGDAGADAFVRATSPEWCGTYRITQRMTEWIERFDERGDVHPTVFTVVFHRSVAGEVAESIPEKQRFLHDPSWHWTRAGID